MYASLTNTEAHFSNPDNLNLPNGGLESSRGWRACETVVVRPASIFTSDAARLCRPATVGGRTVALDPLTGNTTFAALQNTIVPGSGNPVNGIMVNGLTGKGDFTELPWLIASPRLGLAWDIEGNGKTAVRLSLGTFYSRPDANWLPGRGTSPTTFTQTVFCTTINQIPQAAAAAAVSPVNATSVQGHQKVPRATQVNLTIQRAVGFGTAVDIGYVGNFNRHAPVSRQTSPVPLGAYADPNNLFNGTAINANLLRAPYRGMGSVTYQANGLSDLNNHALQINAQRRMTRGLQYGVSYVLSKALGSRGSDPYNIDRAWYYGPLPQDRRHVANVNWVYQIPSLSNQYAKAVLGNWTLSGIASAQTGAPVAPSCSAVSGPVSVTDPTLTGAAARCKVVGNPRVFTQNFFTNFNTAAFALADPGTFGNAGLGILNQPAWWNMDVTLDKRIPLGENTRRVVRARIEAHNVLNRTQFSTMGTTMQLSGATNLSTTYGQFTATRPSRVLSTTIRLEF